MRIIAFSDSHVHPHRFGATVDEATGRQSRLQDGIDALDMTAQAAIDHKADLRVFCGDMFHTRGKLAPSILNPVIEHYRKPSRPFHDELIVGNHDMEHRVEGEHALKALAGERVTVRDGHGYQAGVYINAHGPSLGVGWVAYEPDIKALKDKVKQVAAQARLDTKSTWKLLMIHHGVDGAMDGIPDMGFGPRDLPHEDFTVILCGDYHTHKELVAGKAWMIGAPLQHTFGDAGQKRGYMVIDLAAGTANLVENTNAPKFVTWAKGEAPLTKAIIEGNFVRIRHDDEKELDAIEVAVLTAGAKAVQKELVKDWAAVTRSDVSLSMTTSQMFKTWIADQELPAGVDPDELVKLNDEILEEAGVS